MVVIFRFLFARMTDESCHYFFFLFDTFIYFEIFLNIFFKILKPFLDLITQTRRKKAERCIVEIV